MTRMPEVRVLLETEQARVAARVQLLESDLAALTRARRGESDDDEHDPDGASMSSQWSMLAGLLDAARAEQQAVDDALHRLDQGAYGICASCGHPIPVTQLEVRPFRERCVSCASALGG